MNKIAYYIFDRVINNSLSSLTKRDLLTALHVSSGIFLQKDFFNFSFRVTDSSLSHFFCFVFITDMGLLSDCVTGL